MMKINLPTFFTNACKMERGIDADYQILGSCLNGISVTGHQNEGAFTRLASAGLVRLGTEEVETEDGMIELLPTARATDLGKRVHRIR